MTRLVVLAFLALTRSAWTISTNNRHVRPSVRVFPADYVGLMAQNRTAQTTRSPAMPFPRQSRPFALPHMSKSAKYPPPHPHSIKEMPRYTSSIIFLLHIDKSHNKWKGVASRYKEEEIWHQSLNLQFQVEDKDCTIITRQTKSISSAW